MKCSQLRYQRTVRLYIHRNTHKVSYVKTLQTSHEVNLSYIKKLLTKLKVSNSTLLKHFQGNYAVIENNNVNPTTNKPYQRCRSLIMTLYLLKKKIHLTLPTATFLSLFSFFSRCTPKPKLFL